MGLNPSMKLIRFGVLFAIILLSCQLANLTPIAEEEDTFDEMPGSNIEISPWTPGLRHTWQWQLAGDLDLSVEAEVFDLDLFETDAQTIADLHAKGSRVICYLNVGAWENWREDRVVFPDSVLGADYAGWQGERWLDIRQIDLLKPVIESRLDLCKKKGFDAVEPDNIDGYTNETGFPLTYADQLKYNLWLADEAHARGLLIGLKNDPDQVQDLVGVYDWAMTEDCFDQGWCEQMVGFVQAGKPVFAAEYTDSGVNFEHACSEAARLNFNLIMKNMDLDAYRRVCP